MKRLLLAALFIFSVGPAAARGSASRRAIRRAVWQVNQTPTGKHLNSLRGDPHQLQIYFIFAESDILYRINQRSERNEKLLILRLHGHLRPAWPQYNSWVMVQGLVHYQANIIFSRHGIETPPEGILELDQLAFLKAARHWEELNAPTGKDFAKDSRFEGEKNLAVRLEASVDAWHQVWKTQGFEAFLHKVAARRGSLGYKTQTIEQYLASPLDYHEREAGQELQRLIEKGFAEERAYRSRRVSQGFASSAPSLLLPDLGKTPALKQLRAFGR